MWRFWALLLSPVFLIGCSSDKSAVATNDILIKDVTIVSAHEKNLQAPTDILIFGGRIARTGDLAVTPSAEGMTIVDGTGMYLMPGLIDAHTHLDEVPGMTFDHEQAYPLVAKAARRQIPRSYLYHGFTTVIDLNGHPRVIDAWNALPTGPRAFFCGASPVFDGYPMSFMPKPLRYDIMPYFLYDESRSEEFPTNVSADRHLPEAVVERIQSAGGICVKTHYEKGFGGRGDLPVPSVELIRELVAAAHHRGMPVLLHANSQTAQHFGNEVEVDAFAHGMWTWDDRALTERHPDIEAIVDASIALDIALQPTIQVLYGEQDLHNPEYLDDPRLRHVLPASLLEWYGTEDGQWWRLRMLNIPIVAQIVDEGRWQELDEPPIRRVSTVVEYFSAAGGQLLFGSDTPSDPTFANPPGLNGRIEMERWTEAGVSPAELFVAATRGNAEFFNLSTDVGTVEVGKRADLLLLRDNPLERVSAYDTIEIVILGGQILERATLSAIAD